MSDLQHKKIDDILEIVTFLRDTATTKTELDDVRSRMMQELRNIDARFDAIDAQFEHVNAQFDGINVRFEHVDEKFVKTEDAIISHVDGFVGLHKGLDTELASLRFKYERMEEKMNTILKHLDIR